MLGPVGNAFRAATGFGGRQPWRAFPVGTVFIGEGTGVRLTIRAKDCQST